MKKKRIKIQNPIRTREQMEQEVGRLAKLKISEAKLKSYMDEELSAVRKRYEDSLAGVAEEITSGMLKLQAWAEENMDQFGRLKSLDLLHAKVGWRISPPTVKPAKGWTWKRVLEHLLKLPSMARYIRRTPSINKDAILEDRKNLSVDALLCMGMRIEQKETFYVEPKMTEIERREVQVA